MCMRMSELLHTVPLTYRSQSAYASRNSAHTRYVNSLVIPDRDTLNQVPMKHQYVNHVEVHVCTHLVARIDLHDV